MGQERPRLVLVSNRGPVHHRREGGERVVERGGGGLVTALSDLAAHLEEAVWVCAADGDEDLAAAAETGGRILYRTGMDVRMVPLDPERQRMFYAEIANPLLWFIQHYLWGLATAPDITRGTVKAWEEGYVAVNEAFAAAVAEEVHRLGPGTKVLIQDYHLYLLAEKVREACPEAVLQHFVHIPWPQPDTWRVLPREMRTRVFEGLLGNDVVAFHTERYARNFLLGCQELLDLPVDLAEMSVHAGGRDVRIRWYPISVDPAAFHELAARSEVEVNEARIREAHPGKLVVRVDRTDLSKNIVRGFQAYQLLLEEHPELAGEVTFLALLQPSRQEVEEYREYLESIEEAARQVNEAHGTASWQPVDLRLVEDMDLAAAAYKQYDVLLVNAIYDGMNLVAKEAVLVNENDGVLALSENTGAYAELGAFSVPVAPFDIGQTADALHAALTMNRSERAARAALCKAVVETNDIEKWLTTQLGDLEETAAREEASTLR